MWYRFAQILSDEETIPGWQQEMEFKSGLSRNKNLKNKIDALLQKLPEDKRAEYQKEYENILYRSFNNYQDRVEYINTLINNINRDITKQNTNSLNYIKSIVNKRITGKYINNEFDDADKIFKEYLNAQANTNFISDINNKSNMFEIAKFFLDNATDPKYAPVKNILKKFPTRWMEIAEIGDLFLNFYLYTKLTELKSVLEQRSPQTSDDKLAIMFIDSKSASHALKIGTSLFKIVNKNPFGDLLGSISSSAIDALDSFQNVTNVNKEITKRIQ